jgi:adenine phosphoribosyltransferase
MFAESCIFLMNRAEKAALQLRAVSVLRMLKETRTYDELADLTGLPAGDLNRYVNGHVLPSADRASVATNSQRNS